MYLRILWMFSSRCRKIEKKKNCWQLISFLYCYTSEYLFRFGFTWFGTRDINVFNKRETGSRSNGNYNFYLSMGKWLYKTASSWCSELGNISFLFGFSVILMKFWSVFCLCYAVPISRSISTPFAGKETIICQQNALKWRSSH